MTQFIRIMRSTPRNKQNQFLKLFQKRDQCHRVLRWKEKTVLVSGCNGQVGIQFVNRLAKELGAYKVIATDLHQDKHDKIGPCVYKELDILDEQAFERIVMDDHVD